MKKFFYSLQEKLLFKPTSLPDNFKFETKLPHKEIYLNGKENGIIHSLLLSCEKPKGIMVYYHGNTGGLDRWASIAEFFTERNYEVLVMDYRGFGKSKGERTEELMYDDAELVYNYAKTLYPENKIIVYGRSLGSTFAIHVSSKNTPKHLILEAPFYSIVDIVKTKYLIAPLSIFKYKFESYKSIREVDSLITIFHGIKDKTVPYSSAKKLVKNIKCPQEFITLTKSGHGNIKNSKKYHRKINEILYFS